VRIDSSSSLAAHDSAIHRHPLTHQHPQPVAAQHLVDGDALPASPRQTVAVSGRSAISSRMADWVLRLARASSSFPRKSG
jgi:hypothetical protein